MTGKGLAVIAAGVLGFMAVSSAGAGVVLAVQSAIPRGAGSYDGSTGALLGTGYLSTPGTSNTTPKGIAVYGNNIFVSDQLQNDVFEYTLDGTYVGTLLTSAQINNPRGLTVNNGRLYVTCGSAINGNTGASVQSFALDGTDQQTFIPTVTTTNAGSWSPFDIAFRNGDVLVSNYINTKTANATAADILSFPLSGGATPSTFVLDQNGLSSAEQLLLLANGDVVVAGFNNASGGTGVQAGIYEYSSTGTLVRFLQANTGPRGVAQLSNGEFLFSDASGVKLLDPTTGGITSVGNISSQYLITIPEPAGLFGLLPAAGLLIRRKR